MYKINKMDVQGLDKDYKLRATAIAFALQTTRDNRAILDIAEDYLTFLSHGFNPKNNIANHPPMIGYMDSLRNDGFVVNYGTYVLGNDPYHTSPTGTMTVSGPSTLTNDSVNYNIDTKEITIDHD